MYEIHYKNWLMWLWRPRNPWYTICSWRTKKASGVIQSKFEGLKSKGVSPSPKGRKSEGRMCTSWSECWCDRSVQLQTRRADFALPLPFGSCQAFSGQTMTGWCPLALVKMVFFTYSTHSKTYLNNILPAVWTSLAQSNWCIKLTIINSLRPGVQPRVTLKGPDNSYVYFSSSYLFFKLYIHILNYLLDMSIWIFPKYLKALLCTNMHLISSLILW